MNECGVRVRWHRSDVAWQLTCDWLIHVYSDLILLMCVMSHMEYGVRQWHMTPSYVIRLIHMWYDSFIWDMTHSHVMRFVISDVRDVTHGVWYASMAYGIQTQIWCDITPCVTSDLVLSHVPYEWVMSHVNVTSQIWCDITPCVTLRIYMWYASFIWDMTHSYGTWLIHMGHDSFMSHVTCKCVMSHM